MSVKPIKIVVIGGGAAGFFGAITCAQAHPDVEITILEASHEPLTKVRISGGGRCNVTHACFEPGELVQYYPRGGKALRGAFCRFQPKDMVAWLAAQGVELKTESDGRMFPVTDDSGTIANCLLKTTKSLGIELRTKVRVSSVGQIPGELSKFAVRLKDGEVMICDRLLLASGSNPSGYQIAKTLGHQIVSPVPSLFTFNISDRQLTELAGVSVEKVKLRLQIAGKTHFEQPGAILITHWGLSGPAILKLSAWSARILHENHYQAKLIINWIPDSNPEFLRKQLLAVRSQLPQRQISTTCPLLLPRRLWEYLIARVNIASEDRWAGLSNKTLNQLIQEITQGEYQISGKGVFKEEFVTCGGVDLKEVNFKTMESKCSPGLYFAGEILDIDGVTGGFNFQSAWTTAWLAGQAMGS
ncbi:NAD(P)/FAD-dependent oxidoreductase [Floridanema evergladense]|uniref:NAD(P)/FAD-dependent oxidoreductase n=1 Tax=Floridaenema evergladense BLCC-F167 TaxID=3153639 RepID=A0ABV4WG06_9CYAN